MIDCGNGKEISTIVISTAMGIGGDGIFPLKYIHPGYRSNVRKIRDGKITILTKSSTCEKWIGNFNIWNPLTWKYIQKLGFSPESMVNSYGLTNGGVEKNARKIAMAQDKGFNVIPNFYP